MASNDNAKPDGEGSEEKIPAAPADETTAAEDETSPESAEPAESEPADAAAHEAAGI